MIAHDVFRFSSICSYRGEFALRGGSKLIQGHTIEWIYPFLLPEIAEREPLTGRFQTIIITRGLEKGCSII